MKKNRFFIVAAVLLFAVLGATCALTATGGTSEVSDAAYVPMNAYLDYEIVACNASGAVTSQTSLKESCIVTSADSSFSTQYYKLTLKLKNVPSNAEAYSGTDYYSGDISPFDYTNIDINYIRPKYVNVSSTRTENTDTGYLGMNGKTGDGFTFTVSKKSADGTSLTEVTAAPSGSLYANEISYYITLTGAATADNLKGFNAIDVSFGNNLDDDSNPYGYSFYMAPQTFTIPVYCQPSGYTDLTPAENALFPDNPANDFMMYFYSQTKGLMTYSGVTQTLTNIVYSMEDIDGEYLYLPLYDEYNTFAFDFKRLNSVDFHDNDSYEFSIPSTQSDVTLRMTGKTSDSYGFMLGTNGVETIQPLTITRKVFGTVIHRYTLYVVTYKPDASYFQMNLGVEKPNTATTYYGPKLFADGSDGTYRQAVAELFTTKWFLDNNENGIGLTQSFGQQTEGSHEIVVSFTNNLSAAYYSYLGAGTTYTDADCPLQKYSPYPSALIYDFDVLRHCATENLSSIEFKGGNRFSMFLEHTGGDGAFTDTMTLKVAGEVADSDAEIDWSYDSGLLLTDDDSTINGASREITFLGEGTFRVTAAVTTSDGRQLKASATIVASITAPKLIANKSAVSLDVDASDTSLTVGYNLDGVYTEMMDTYYVCSSDDSSIAVISYAFDESIEAYKFIVTGLKEGETHVNVIKMLGEGSAQIVSIKVTVGSTDDYVVPSIAFSEGSKIIMYLQDSGRNITAVGGNTDEGTYYFYCLDDKVATVVSTGATATVKPVAVGTTVIVVTYEDDAGNKTFGNIGVEVVREKPTVKITVERKSGTSDAVLNIYDDLVVTAVHSYNFTYSANASIVWEIDGNTVAGLGAKDKSFETKLTAGTHTVSVTITDIVYGISIRESKNVAIAAVADAERTLAFGENDKLYLALSGGTYTVNALIDGVIDDAYVYSWGVDNNNIVTAAVVAGKSYQAEIIPRAAGTTTLFVYVTVGNYQQKVLSARLDIEVQKVDTLAIVGAEEYYKPGNNGVYTLNCNGRADFKNLNAGFTADIEGEAIEFTQSGNTITINNLKEGYLNITADAAGNTTSQKSRITSVNFEKIVKEMVPYLLLAVAVVLLIVLAFKKKKTTLQTIAVKTDKLRDYTEKTVLMIGDGAKAPKIKRRIAAIHRKTKRIKSLADYAKDKGVDEISAVSDEAVRLLKITTAALATTDKTTDTAKLKNLLENVLHNNIARMKNEADEINTIREKFSADIAVEKAEAAAEINLKPGWKIKKSEKKSFDTYSRYLNDMRYMDSPDDGNDTSDIDNNDGNDDRSGED